MGIVSGWFILLTVVTVIFYDLFSVRRYGWLILLVASIVFYVSFSPAGLLVLIPDALISWAAALRIQKLSNTQNEENYDVIQKAKRRCVIGNAVINVVLLFLFNYYSDTAVFLNAHLGTGLWDAENLFVAVGISYFSLKLISYTADVCGGITEAEKDPLKVILYTIFFLSVMQGPFERYGKLIPQLTSPERPRLTYRSIKNAVIRIIYGYIKKLCIADQLAFITAEVFTNYGNYHGLAVLTGIFCYAVQLYADFSGYMDIVCGIGQLMGIEVTENFRQPFFSRNLQEFWRRWHITLGAWLKDYVFYPLMRTRLFEGWSKAIYAKTRNKFLRKLPAFTADLTVWFLIGLWHGSGFNYIFGVGLLQFLYIFCGTVTKPFTDRLKALLHINEKKGYWRVVQGVKCTLLMSFAWIFFNSASFSDALGIIGNIFDKGFSFGQYVGIFTNNVNENYLVLEAYYNNGSGVVGSWYCWLLFILASTFVLFIVDLIHENDVLVSERIAARPYVVRLVFYMLLIFSLIVFGAYGNTYDSADFIYFRF